MFSYYNEQIKNGEGRMLAARITNPYPSVGRTASTTVPVWQQRLLLLANIVAPQLSSHMQWQSLDSRVVRDGKPT